MDLNKFKIWQSGMTEEEYKKELEYNNIQDKFKEEKANIQHTVGTKGFQFILDKIIADIEYTKNKLTKCNKKDLNRLQLEIEVRSDFLHKWQDYM